MTSATVTARAVELRGARPAAHDDEHALRQDDPLLSVAIRRLYDATDLLHRLMFSHGCRPERCGLCHDVRQSLAHLDVTLSTLEGFYLFAGNEGLTLRREESRACREDTRRRSPRPWRPGCGESHPLHALAVLSLVNAGRALDALARADVCGPYVTQEAEQAAWLVPLLVGQIEATLIPTPEFLRLRFGRGRAQALRLLLDAQTFVAGVAAE
jgi:hypothetical protein